MKAARALEDIRSEGSHLGNLGLLHARAGDVAAARPLLEAALIIGRQISSPSIIEPVSAALAALDAAAAAPTAPASGPNETAS